MLWKSRIWLETFHSTFISLTACRAAGSGVAGGAAAPPSGQTMVRFVRASEQPINASCVHASQPTNNPKMESCSTGGCRLQSLTHFTQRAEFRSRVWGSRFFFKRQSVSFSLLMCCVCRRNFTDFYCEIALLCFTDQSIYFWEETISA